MNISFYLLILQIKSLPPIHTSIFFSISFKLLNNSVNESFFFFHQVKMGQTEFNSDLYGPDGYVQLLMVEEVLNTFSKNQDMKQHSTKLMKKKKRGRIHPDRTSQII